MNTTAESLSCSSANLNAEYSFYLYIALHMNFCPLRVNPTSTRARLYQWGLNSLVDVFRLRDGILVLTH